jgi:hypothetical protein
MLIRTELPHIYCSHGLWLCRTNMALYPSLSDRAMWWCRERNAKAVGA